MCSGTVQIAECDVMVICWRRENVILQELLTYCVKKGATISRLAVTCVKKLFHNLLWSWRPAIETPVWKKLTLTAGEMDQKLLVVTGFLCDKAAMIMAMQREEISEMLYVLFQGFWICGIQFDVLQCCYVKSLIFLHTELYMLIFFCA